MYTNELLEEIWAIKRELAREADDDMDKYLDRLQEFSESRRRTQIDASGKGAEANYPDLGVLPASLVREESEPSGLPDPPKQT